MAYTMLDTNYKASVCFRIEFGYGELVTYIVTNTILPFT